MDLYDRDVRQSAVADWAARCFGGDEANSLPQRGLRLAEEAIEAAQAAGTDPAQLHAIIDYIYARPVGEIKREIGGVGTTLLAYAAAARVSAEACEIAEVVRILSKPAAHFAERNRTKNDAGFLAPAASETKDR